jgi:hypothetical protein
VVDGGKDGFTSVGTLEKAAAAFVKTYVTTNGDIDKATKAAQQVIDDSAVEMDKGDKVEKTKKQKEAQ